ncbi:hypothetical protein DSO57_1027490 [Entomophthora muscae]|nr:hypothetical protein DSO57_1027490 [Entomophthora muscae]
MNTYIKHYGGKKLSDEYEKSLDKINRTEMEILSERNRFLYEDSDEVNNGEDTESWEKRIAKNYYDKLFKEYCIGNLLYYREGKIALRWRTELEVVTGKGQTSCGNISCTSGKKLKIWEVNFGYLEDGIKKNALVKICLCKSCSKKLNHIKPVGKQLE